MEDIKDSEIRFIGDEKPFDSNAGPQRMTMLEDVPPQYDPPPRRSIDMMKMPDQSGGGRSRLWIIILSSILLIFLLFFLYCCFLFSPAEGIGDVVPVADEDVANAMFEPENIGGQFEAEPPISDIGHIDSLLILPNDSDSYCDVRQDVINDIPYRIFLPHNAVPDFHVGKLNQRDASIILAMQAADIRRDNGKIVGACVYHGEVISKGLAKKGYVAIIDGQLSVGVTDHSPLFEEAIERDGCFFRQYPIVSEGSIVENNPKNISIRRAICERKGQYFVTETMVPVSFHDFSQMLVDMNVSNAVYLVGSQYACGFMRDASQQLQSWGEIRYSRAKNVSYIVWRKMP